MSKLLILIIVFWGVAVYGQEEQPESLEVKPKKSSEMLFEPQEQFPPEIVLEPKSTRKAMALSALLPGLGEHYMGYKSDAIRAYVIEGAIWLTYLGMRWYAGVLTNDYILYAHVHSGAKTGSDELYYDAVEWYNDLDAYNEYIRQEARELYPDDTESRLRYIEENKLSEDLRWSWDNDSKWSKYRNLRKEKREVLQRVSYCIGAAILNRVISAVIASRVSPRYGLLIEPNGIKLAVTF